MGRRRASWVHPFEWAGPGLTPFFLANSIAWEQFKLQTVFLSVLAAVLVNIPWPRIGPK
jgi:hypothetical protein